MDAIFQPAQHSSDVWICMNSKWGVCELQRSASVWIGGEVSIGGVCVCVCEWKRGPLV